MHENKYAQICIFRKIKINIILLLFKTKHYKKKIAYYIKQKLNK